MDRSLVKFYFLLISGFAAGCLNLAAQPDTAEIIRAWQLHGLYTEKQSVEIDTAITSFHVHNPVFRRSISSSYLGNAGLAAKSNIFSQRELFQDFIFINHFLVYLQQPAGMKYYNTRRPFSLIDFSTGGPRGQNEKMLGLLHTQNVNPDFNLGFRYFNINSDGQYQHQSAITNAISLFSSYELEDYSLHANINLNSANVFENGGLADDSNLSREGFETLDHPVRLQNVRNGVSNNSLFLSQAWKPFFFSPADTLTGSDASWFRGLELFHVLQFNQYRRTYVDANPAATDFYPDFLINNNSTFDSVYYRSFTNKLMVKLPAFQRGIVGFDAKGGIKNELIRGNYNIPQEVTYHFNYVEDPAYYLFAQPADTTIRTREEHRFGTTAVVATARGSLGEIFSIWGEGNLYFQGYRQGEYDMQAGIRFDFFEGKNRSVIGAEARQRNQHLHCF
jgi:hypothetical protein